MAWSDEIAAAIQRIRDEVGPSVVGVGRQGSGIVIGSGLVATNAHNLRAESVGVALADGVVQEGRVAGANLDGDLAVVTVDTGPAPAVTWSTVSGGLGDVVFGVANPGGSGLRVTFGTISSVGQAFRGPRGRRIPASLEHTAPLPPGSSGGPVVDVQGRVLGINTHRLAESFYLARPADPELVEGLTALAQGQVPRRPRLGVSLAPPRAARRLREAVGLPDVPGLLIRAVEEGSPAARADLRRGDVISSLGGQPVTSLDDLYDLLETAGDTIELGVVRGTEAVVVAVDLLPSE